MAEASGPGERTEVAAGGDGRTVGQVSYVPVLAYQTHPQCRMTHRAVARLRDRLSGNTVTWNTSARRQISPV